MRIAHLLPYSAVFPLKKHNGRYEWALRLANLQAAEGHEVTIYAGPGSYTIGPPLHWRSLQTSIGDRAKTNRALIELALHSEDHDIYHSHFDALHYSIPSDKPIIATQHWFPNEKIAQAAAATKNKHILAVPITHAMQQQDALLGIPCTEVIYHGIELDAFKPSQQPHTDRLLYLGRISPQKGVLEAVKAAYRAGEKLDIVGKINPSDNDYWRSVLPYLNNHIRYLGPKQQMEVAELLARAKALLFLPQAAEAFGQVVIESQACGTPVILNRNVAADELIINGTTGFIANNEEECINAMNRVTTLDTEQCRDFAERFAIAQMTQAYEQLYDHCLALQ